MSNDAFQKNQSVVGGVGNDTGIGFSHSMFALSPHSRVTQQLPGTGEDGLCKCLYILELLNCYLRWIGTDQVSVLTASSGVRRDDGINNSIPLSVIGGGTKLEVVRAQTWSIPAQRK